ncbi:MAG: homoserine dehydrogenase [Proteobacteria bacterium]|nr:homoserine dehydrogenase [Pseudomonadota bacterium]MBU1389539.1 homoserine dehydrogenase [Pseudomonadota bacterium]MBU1544403.1 homoserine dehydrogenase [Pseudomonadota bacterium]MBU2480677.1 homoserine dehydrogenase [Pseudomonadota bacterium]
MEKINIGILGYGVVGTGVAKLLKEKKQLLEHRVGAQLNLKTIADIDTTTDRGINLGSTNLISDGNLIIEDPDIHIIVETIGGQTIAREFILKALEHKKHVVTANKALLAGHGNLLMKTAKENQVDLAFEASCGGCMPIIKSLRESLVANNITSMSAILNGTCNYILTRISNDGSSFEAALKDAQDLGYAEAEPSLDIDGHDTAHKLAILNALAHGMEINLKDIHVEGIRNIRPEDIQFAKEFGYTIKLLAIGKIHDNHVEARVHPTMIPDSNPLSNVNSSMNAIVIEADATGQTMLYGHGAGMMPTASAVLSDIADIARNIISGGNTRVPILGYLEDHIQHIPILNMAQLNTRYYLRFEAQDHPGVLSRISGVLGENNISIESVHQKGRNANGKVPIMMITHLANEASVQNALKQISTTQSVIGSPVIIRIEETP